jgi:hypothetical protein
MKHPFAAQKSHPLRNLSRAATWRCTQRISTTTTLKATFAQHLVTSKTKPARPGWWYILADGSLVMPGWFFRCPKKGSGMIFDAPSENQLLSFSTGCGEYQFSDILCMSPPSNALTSAVKLELSHRNAIVGII